MKVKLTYNKDKRIIGYTMEGEIDDDKHIVNAIRDMHFFGLGDKVLVYNGREGGCDKWAGRLRFTQKGERK